MPGVLVTGFGPFPKAPENPSAGLARRIARHPRLARAGLRARVHVFKTVYEQVEADLRALAAQRPRAVLMLGLAMGRRSVSLERRARPCVSPRHADAGGAKPPSDLLGAGADRTARADLAALTRLLRRVGLPVRISADAGLYVCNAAYWWALGTFSPRTPVLFVHLPPRFDAARLAGALARLVRAMAAPIRTSRRR